MINVGDARAQLLGLVSALPSENVSLRRAAGRVLAKPATARRDQPPFPASAMDGYAVRSADIHPGARLTVIGESAAGRRFAGPLSAGQAVRIFTGAPVPEQADRVVIQEDVTRQGDRITVNDTMDSARYIRPAGTDFSFGMEIEPHTRLRPSDIALLAAMNLPVVPAVRKPVVALVATGDELAMPGETPGPDQIIASNTFGLAAMIEDAGGIARIMPIARDNPASLRTVLEMASGADLIVTIGGASVGDHDIVAEVTGDLGLERAFYKVAMRPGKPLMAGNLNGTPLIGLPGNPVSSMVCGHIFILPMLRVMLGLKEPVPTPCSARLGIDLPQNGPREHYMRARIANDTITPFERQDSALLTVLTQANALLIRPVNDPAQSAGAIVRYLAL